MISPHDNEHLARLSSFSSEGVAVSGARDLDAPGREVELPLGLGSRHMAAAAVTQKTAAVAVVVSESSIVRVFFGGELIAEIIPELWMLSRYRTLLEGAYDERSHRDVTVVSRTD